MVCPSLLLMSLATVVQTSGRRIERSFKVAARPRERMVMEIGQIFVSFSVPLTSGSCSELSARSSNNTWERLYVRLHTSS